MRRRILGTALLVALLTALLVPLERMLSKGADTPLNQKQAAVKRALEMEEERKALSVPAPVQPVVDIEDVWAIEDARTYTDEQLVDGMFCGGDVLGYDAQSRTFYCTLGLDNEDAWPIIDLKARGAQGVQVMWVDDYSYDWCADAIAEGYRYELIAYTEAQYSYIGVVFTGLPIVALQYEGEISMENDIPGRVTVAAAGYAPVDSAMVVHERGGGYTDEKEKKSYRLEMHMLGNNGKDEKRCVSVLGMEPDSDWMLLSNNGEVTSVRNKLAWDVWRDWNEGKDALMVMDNELVEVFVNDEYMGLYQLMERIQEEEEIALVGGNADTDGVLRVIAANNPTERPVLDLQNDVGFKLEYRYERHDNANRLFELAKDYAALLYTDDRRLDDEAFEALALELIDIEDMMNYILFYHACTLQDNARNNVYLYMLRQEDGRYLFRHAPWDMDSGFWVRQESADHNVLRAPDMSMVLPARMLELNVGNCREILWDLWNEKRATVLSEESLYNRFMDMEQRINASGADLRETEKWYGGAVRLNLTEMDYYTQQCLNLLRLTIEGLWPVEGKELLQ